MVAGIILLAILAVVLAMLVLGGGGQPNPSTEPTGSAEASGGGASLEPIASVQPSAQPSTGASAEPEPAGLADRVLVAEADGLRLRSAPSEEGDVLATLRRGLRMGATGAIEGDWVEVRIGPGPLTGWVSAGPDRSWLRVVADGAIAFHSSGRGEGSEAGWVLATPFDEAALDALAGDDVIEIAWSPDGTNVAMTVADADGTAVAIADSDGSNPRTVGPGGYGPSWSPDGQLSWSSAEGMVIADESLNPRVLATVLRNPGRPFWSPDSTRIAVVAMDCPECPADEPIVGDVPGAIYVVDVPSGATTKLTEPGYYGFGGWSPDGGRLTYSTIDLSGAQPPQAFSVGADGGAATPLLDGGPAHEAPTWSPDGSRMALGTPDGLVILAGDGSGPSVLVPTNAFVSVGQWSPGGAWIVFQTGDGPDTGLWIVRADGSEAPRRVTSTDVSAGMPAWQPRWEPLP